MAPARFSLLLLALALAACGKADTVGRRTPSGLAVPRYVSLKFNDVNARQGPSEDDILLYTYHAKGMPVQVIAETDDWRRICDAEGQVSWVKKSGVDGARTVFNAADQPLPLLSRPRPGASPSAYLGARSTASLGRCAGDWCRVEVGRKGGWALSSQVWGALPALQCH